jgi:NAD-dependent protein deacetylase/lipoamidase
VLDTRVLVITGAGVSAESGIPTFRGRDGYWRNLDPAKLATPEAFARDPQLVWEWYRERRQRIRAAKPNPAHEAIARLAAEAREFLLVTQNVDDLHVRARWKGKPPWKDQMVQIHGDIFVTRCSQCEFQFSAAEHEQEQEKEQEKHRLVSCWSEVESQHQDLPVCPRCGALMRPGVVWFGEQLDRSQIGRVEAYLARGRCDAVIVIGTTAIFGYIVDWAIRAAGKDGQLIEVNPDPSPLSQVATQVIREPAGVGVPRLVEQLAAATRS